MGRGRDGDCCCCDHSICVSAWSMAAICADVAAETPPDCSDHAVPGGFSGAVVTVTRSFIDDDGLHVETIDTCTTGSSGRCCCVLPLGIPDPVAAPTVDPVGGGSSGCLLTPDTYDFRYSHRNAYPIGGGAFGETLASFPAGPFQVGIPDPGKFPFAAGLSARDTGGRAGFLAVGVYWARHTYANASGETVTGNVVKFRVGMLEPTASFTQTGIGGGGSLAPGNYDVRVSATDGTYYTDPVHYPGFTQTAGDVYGLVNPPALPFGCTGWTVWLSDDSGVTWYRYLHNVLPAFNVSVGGLAIPFSVVGQVNPFGIPSANNFPVYDPTIVFPASMASLRTYATEQRLYLSKTNATTLFRIYATGITAGSFDCLNVFPASGASFPTSNSAARNIPLVTFTTGGYTSVIYAKSMTDGTCKSFPSKTSPKALSGSPSGTACSNALNTTRAGDYLVSVKAEGAVEATYTLHALYGCFTAGVAFGFCDYVVKLDVTDHDGGDVAGWFVVGDSGHVTYDADGLSVVRGLAPVEMTACVFYADESGTLALCRDDDLAPPGVYRHPQHITLRATGYWDRCVAFDTPCDIPAITTTIPVDMYSKANWVQDPCCAPCPELPEGATIPEMIPAGLMASFLAPEAVTGSTSAVLNAITYNPTRSAALGKPVWDAMVETGGWSYCMNASLSDAYLCLKPGPDPYNPCTDPVSTRPNVVYSKHFYSSARLTWSPTDNSCKGDLTWENFWGSGPDDDTPPTCETGTLQGEVWCEADCPCGEVRPDGHGEVFAAGTFPTKTMSTSAPNSPGDAIGPTTTGTYTGLAVTCAIVNWSQAQNPILPTAYNLCPSAPAPVCSGTVTES